MSLKKKLKGIKGFTKELYQDHSKRSDVFFFLHVPLYLPMMFKIALLVSYNPDLSPYTCTCNINGEDL